MQYSCVLLIKRHFTILDIFVIQLMCICNAIMYFCCNVYCDLQGDLRACGNVQDDTGIRTAEAIFHTPVAGECSLKNGPSGNVLSLAEDW